MKHKGARMQFIPLSKINVLPQMRKTFDSIPELASNIEERGLIHPITVARLNASQAKQYLRFINKVHKKKIPLRELVTYRKSYHILIAGERRMRACKLLKYNQIRSSICVGISAQEAIKIQGSENTNFPVPPEEEAVFYERFYKLLSLSSGKAISQAAFSVMVGRSPSVIRAALRFAELPDYIRNPVTKKLFPYGIAVELARAHEAGIQGEELKDLFIRAASGSFTVASFKKFIDSFLQDAQNNQMSLLTEFFSEKMLQEEKLLFRKKSIEKEISNYFHASGRYFLRVLHLFNSSLLGVENSPFSEKGPLESFKKHLGLLKLLLPHLDALASSLAKEGRSVIRKSEERIKEIERYIY